MDAAQLRLVERRIVATLRKLHRSRPLDADVRIDALLAQLNAAPTGARRHRGGTQLALSDADWLAEIARLATAGRLVRTGHRIRLDDHRPQLGPEMRRRADRVVAELRAAGLAPVRAETVARRHGIPGPVLEALRTSGELVGLAPGMDVSLDVYRRARGVIEALPDEQRRVESVAERLGVSRRIARILLGTVDRGRR